MAVAAPFQAVFTAGDLESRTDEGDCVFLSVCISVGRDRLPRTVAVPRVSEPAALAALLTRSFWRPRPAFVRGEPCLCFGFRPTPGPYSIFLSSLKSLAATSGGRYKESN